MSTDTISPLRQRMIEDMTARKLCAATQTGHIRSCKRQRPAHCSTSPRLPPTRNSSQMARRMRHVCCLARARAVALA